MSVWGVSVLRTMFDVAILCRFGYGFRISRTHIEESRRIDALYSSIPVGHSVAAGGFRVIQGGVS